MEIKYDGLTPDSNNSPLINSSMTDFPLRRMPVITFISSPPMKGRIRLIYNSRFITETPPTVSDTNIPHLHWKNNGISQFSSIILDIFILTAHQYRKYTPVPNGQSQFFIIRFYMLKNKKLHIPTVASQLPPICIFQHPMV